MSRSCTGWGAERIVVVDAHHRAHRDRVERAAGDVTVS
jgi:hypothetical protein